MVAKGEPWGDIAIRNLVVLCLGALPVGVLAFSANEAWLVEGGAWMSWSELLLIYLTLVLPIGLGGYLHQLLTLWIAQRHRPRTVRAFSTVSAPVVLAGLPVMVDYRLLVRSALPVVIALAVYLILMRYPKPEESIN